MDIQQLKLLKVMVIGDFCKDVFKYGYCNRLSPEAPVPVFLFDSEISTDGMAGNVKNNLLSLGLEVDLICNEETIIKERYVDIKSKQHLLRSDYEKQIKSIDIKQIPNLKKYDSIVISDYNKGTINEDNVKYIINNFSGPIFVDSKKEDLSIFENCILKINNAEHKKVKKYPKKFELIVTLGSDGAMYKNEIIPTIKTQVFDVSGAGDTFLSGLVVKYLLTKDIKSSIMFANICASKVVQKTGTSIINFEEVRNDLRI